MAKTRQVVIEFKDPDLMEEFVGWFVDGGGDQGFEAGYLKDCVLTPYGWHMDMEREE